MLGDKTKQFNVFVDKGEIMCTQFHLKEQKTGKRLENKKQNISELKLIKKLKKIY